MERLVVFSTDPFDRYEGDECSFFSFFLFVRSLVGGGGGVVN